MEKLEEKKEIELKKKYPFDQYGRYAIIRNIINKNRKDNEAFKILDVGGRGNIMREFLPLDNVYYLDPYADGKEDNYIEGDGCDMPLENESFDWVVSGDVFEHIPFTKREVFIKENFRVAKIGVVLAAPFYSEKIEQAEKNANNFYKILKGKDYPWLKEHLENGLPKEKLVEDYLSKKKISYQKIRTNNLILWEILIVCVFSFLENKDEKILKEYNDFNFYYNSKIYPHDFTEPSYRKIYFIKKRKNLENLQISEKNIKQTEILNAMIKGLCLISTILKRKSLKLTKVNNVIEELRQAIQRSEKEFKNQKAVIEKLTESVREKDNYVQELKTGIELMQSSKFWKIRNKYLTSKYIIFNFPQLIKRYCKISLRVFKRDGSREVTKRIKYLMKNPEEVSIKNYPQLEDNYNKERKKIDVRLKGNSLTYIRMSKNFSYRPLISVIMPVYNVEIKWLKKTIDSVIRQFYDNWELCIVDDASTKKEIKPFLKKYCAGNKKIKIHFLKKNAHVSLSSNRAIQMASGEFIMLLDNDDEITPDAIYQNIKVLNVNKDLDIIYSDEDKIDQKGNYSELYQKPDFDMEKLLHFMYINHLTVYRRKIIDELGGFRKGYEGSQDYDLILRAVEKTRKIFHIKKTLYHWRKLPDSTAVNPNSKKYAYVAGKRALEDYLKRNNIKGEIIMPIMGRYKILKK